MAVFPMQQILMNWAHLGCWKISLFLFSNPPLNQPMAIENTIWMGKKTESGDWWAGCTMNFFCWKYSRVETFLVTLRESDLMGLPVDRVAVPANIVKSHGKWCCNCQRKHNLPHVVDIHEIHNLLSMQWPLHQISVFIMGNMDCVMPSSPSILTLFLGDLTCLSSRDCLCHIIGILPSHQLYWTQHQLTWDALLASAETWAEWLSLSVGWPSPQGLDSASGGQADIGAPTPTNPDSFSTSTYTAISSCS